MDNPDALNFQPREMVLEVSRTILHFAQDEEFHAAVSESGYYREGASLACSLTCGRAIPTDPSILLAGVGGDGVVTPRVPRT